MILYYTYKQKTKIFAKSLGKVLGYQVHELESSISKKSGLRFMIHALKLIFTRKTYPVDNMPAVIPGEIFVCSPVWGGHIAAPCKYFLEKSDLKKTTVNLVLTAGIPTHQYKKAAEKYLRTLDCVPGTVHLFATSNKIMPDEEVLAEQLCEIFRPE